MIHICSLFYFYLIIKLKGNHEDSVHPTRPARVIRRRKSNYMPTPTLEPIYEEVQGQNYFDELNGLKDLFGKLNLLKFMKKNQLFISFRLI